MAHDSSRADAQPRSLHSAPGLSAASTEVPSGWAARLSLSQGSSRHTGLQEPPVRFTSFSGVVPAMVADHRGSLQSIGADPHNSKGERGSIDMRVSLGSSTRGSTAPSINLFSMGMQQDYRQEDRLDYGRRMSGLRLATLGGASVANDRDHSPSTLESPECPSSRERSGPGSLSIDLRRQQQSPKAESSLPPLSAQCAHTPRTRFANKGIVKGHSVLASLGNKVESEWIVSSTSADPRPPIAARSVSNLAVGKGMALRTPR